MKNKKRFLALLLVAVLGLIAFTGCSSTGAADPVAAAEDDVVEIALIIKATDSPFWQKVADGGRDYAAEHEGVNVTIYGAPSESDFEKALTILDDVINSQPDGIVIGTDGAEGAVPAIERATEMGIPVITIDTEVPSDQVVTHLATDNVAGGAMAADAMVEYLNAAGIALKGKVGIVAGVAGVDTIIKRDNGFIDRMAEIAPEIEILEPRYIEGDPAKGMIATEDFITTYDDLIGVYGDCCFSGTGLASAMEQSGLQDEIIAIAFDDDPSEVEALQNGVIKALIIQDQHNMGYAGCESIMKVKAGEELPKFIDTGVQVTSKEDL
ncbi:ABC transporter substrate-binding protein [Gottschalkiaceae bacterium SANA]|nr:ABC transporter substrate-binding protein [Gottschalkiaceae bacterium SANA]